MSRIKKRGLDYFPLDIDFLQNRLVRRIMKREGDGALATLVSAFSCIYGGEGYYVLTDAFFYEDISANLYHQTAEDVKRILTLAAEYGIFDVTLFRECGVLTSAGIQRQYLFSTKRRKSSAIDNRFNLITDEQEDDDAGKQGEAAGLFPETSGSETEVSAALPEVSTTLPESAMGTSQNVTLIPENVASGTHSIAQNSIAQNSIAEHSVAKNRKDSPSPSSPEAECGNTESGNPKGEEEKEKEERGGKEGGKEENFLEKNTEAPLPSKRREWTNETLSELQPPTDGIGRNYDGLLYNMRLYGIPPMEQYAIIRKSNFGAIGEPVWKGFCALRDSCGKIKMPGRYLLSVMNR